jgi:type IV pilus assembly protein PilM
LGVAQIQTSLIPREILTQRLIRAKKPWTLAGLTALMLGMSFNYWFVEQSWSTTRDDLWKSSLSQVDNMKSYRDGHVSKDGELETRLTYLNAERRLKWLEVIRAVNAAVPRTAYPDGKVPTPKELPYSQRKDIHVTSVDTKRFEDLADWWTDDVKTRHAEELNSWARVTNQHASEEEKAEFKADIAAETGPTGKGWVIELRCYHYYNDPNNRGEIESDHVRKYMTTSFMNSTVDLPTGQKDANGQDITETFTLEEMGVKYPLLLDDNRATATQIPNPDHDPSAMITESPLGGAIDQNNLPEGFEPPMLQVRKLDFVYQIVWQEKSIAERLAAKEEARLAAEEAATAAQQAADDQAAASQ